MQEIVRKTVQRFRNSKTLSSFAKGGNPTQACLASDRAEDGNRHSAHWTAMIAAYVKHKKAKEALLLYEEMKAEGLKPSSETFVYVLNACACCGSLEMGKSLHRDAAKAGMQRNVYVSNALVDMYAKCGDLIHARLVFDSICQPNVVSWTAMISGYAKRKCVDECLRLFWRMKRQRIKPNERTYVPVANACACAGDLELGLAVSEEIATAGFQSNIFVANALIDMFGKCGSISHAKGVFEAMPIRDKISWTSMIKATALHGKCEDALRLFYEMREEGLQPDRVTFICMLNLCTKLAALDLGEQLHSEIVKAGFRSDVIVGNALVDLYSKCGNLNAALKVFNTISSRNVISWTTMIAGFSLHCRGKEAFELFWQMRKENVKPDEATFTCLLSLCSHLGLLDDALQLFTLMLQEYRLTPKSEHYGCIVDLFGRAGDLSKAKEMLQQMPGPPGVAQWTALLAASRLHQNVELAEFAIEHILTCEPQSSAALVQLGNIYAQSGRQEDSIQLRKTIRNRGL